MFDAGQDNEAPPDGFVPLKDQLPIEVFSGPYHVSSSGAGRRIGFRVKPRHLNARRGCHGGVLMVFADAQGYLFESVNGPAGAPTVNCTIDFLAPVAEGAWVEAAPEITRETRSMIFFRSLFTVEGITVASCSGIYKKPGSGPRPTQ